MNNIQDLLIKIENLETELCSAISKIENLQRSEFKLEEELKELKEKYNDNDKKYNDNDKKYNDNDKKYNDNDKKINDSSDHILSYMREEYKGIL